MAGEGGTYLGEAGRVEAIPTCGFVSDSGHHGQHLERVVPLWCPANLLVQSLRYWSGALCVW